MKTVATITGNKTSTRQAADRRPLIESLEGRQLLSTSPLPAGGIVTKSITSVGQTDTLTFAAKQGASIELNSAFTAQDSGFNPRFTLTGPNFSTYSWTGKNTIVKQNLPAGNYTLSVADTAVKRRGSYSVGLEGLSPISPSPIGLSRGGVVNGSIDTVLDVKEYVFNVNANGGMAQIATAFKATDSGFNPRFTLYNSVGGTVKTWTGTNDIPLQNLPAGQYMLEVGDTARGRRGTFSIGLEFQNQPFSPEAIPLANRTNVNGSITGVLDVKQYTFAALGTSATFSTTGTALDSGFNARFTLYNTQGGSVLTWTGKHAGTITGLTTGGYYTLQVQDTANSRRGSFTINADGVRPVTFAPIIASLAATATTVTKGQSATLTASGLVDLGNDVSVVSFYRESNGKPGLQTGAGGDTLVANDTSAAGGYTALFSTTTISAGTYTLYAQGLDSNGAYGNIVTRSIIVK